MTNKEKKEFMAAFITKFAANKEDVDKFYNDNPDINREKIEHQVKRTDQRVEQNKTLKIIFSYFAVLIIILIIRLIFK